MESRPGAFSARSKFWLASLSLLVGFAAPVHAAVFYVRVSGNDANDGLTPATAFASIRHAARSIINAGDRVVVGPGSYPEGDISPARNGIPTRPITFFADTTGLLTGEPPGPVVVMPGPTQQTGFIILGQHDIIIDGFTITGSVDAGIQVRRDRDRGINSYAISIINNTVRDSAKRGIDVSVGGSARVSGNTASHNSSSGITVQGEPSTEVTIDVSSNSASQNMAQGIVVQRVGGGMVDANQISDNGGTGLQVRESSNLTVSNNVVSNSLYGGIGIGTGGGVGSIGDCDDNGAVTIDELLMGINIVLGMHPVSVCPAYDPHGAGEVTVVELIRATDIALGNRTNPGTVDAEYAITDNIVENNATFGIYVTATGQITVLRNRVLHSGTGGLSMRLLGSPATANVTANTLGMGGGSGLFLSGATGGTVQNNTIFGNDQNGITVRAASDVQIANNLVYSNRENGVTIGTGIDSDAVSRATIANNTIYKNGGWGLVVGNLLVASPEAFVVNNIFNLNAIGGITAQRLSYRAGYVSAFNLNTDGYGEDTVGSPSDFSADPLFENPPGVDGVLGGVGFADDDFRLRSGSAAIDAGSTPASDVGITGAATPGGTVDDGMVDLGYHYNASVDQVITMAVPELFMPIYVRAQGNPNNDGLSPERALSSIRAAGLRATSSTTIIVGPGQYAEGDIRVRAFVRNVKFVADAAGTLTGDPPGWVLVNAAGTGAQAGFVVTDGPGTVIDGFHVTGGFDAGIQIRKGSDGAQVRNTVVFSNARRGIEANSAHDVRIENNLVYSNGTGGIRVAESENSMVLNNTVCGNGVEPVLGAQATGILIGGGVELGPTRGTVVVRNIVQGNPVGVLATNNAHEGYVTGFNVSLDGFAVRTPRADSDFIADALFVNPPGNDGILGGSGFADDDFRLIQDQEPMSPAVDIDYGEINTLVDGSTRSDGMPDTGPADAGYHYPLR